MGVVVAWEAGSFRPGLDGLTALAGTASVAARRMAALDAAMRGFAGPVVPEAAALADTGVWDVTSALSGEAVCTLDCA